MGGRVGPAVFVAVVVLASVAAIPAAVAETAPSIHVSRPDGQDIDSGDSFSTIRDPQIDLVAEATADNASIDQVVVRVDGNTQHVLDGDGDGVDTRVRLDLSQGNNDVRIIATDTDGNAESTRFEVFEDLHAPRIRLTSPYETDPFGGISDGNASGSLVTFAGDITEFPETRRIRLSYSNGNYSGVRTIRDPGANFLTDVRLGLGTNQVRLTTEDSLGNVRIYDFEVGVTDDRSPNITLSGPPNVTTDLRVDVTGVATDDTWIQEVRANATEVGGNDTVSHTLIGSREYDPANDRWRVHFDDGIAIQYGTYEFTVTAVDTSGNEVTKSFTVERRLPGEVSVAPDIVVDHERTLYLPVHDPPLLVTGSVVHGRTKRVAIETRNVSTGETVGYKTLHSGSVASTVDVNTWIDVAPGISKVLLYATDTNGTEHTKTFYVNATSERTFVGPSGTGPGPAVTITPLSTGLPQTASANVQVSRVAAGKTVHVPPGDHARKYVTRAANVTFEKLSLTAAEPANFTLYVRTTEGSAVDSTFTSSTGVTAVGTIGVEHAVNETAIADATLRFRIRRSYLNATGLAPANVTLYRKHDGNWSALPTDAVGSNGDYRTFRATSPGLSLFAIGPSGGPVPAGNATTATATATNETAANETTSNETATTGGSQAPSPNVQVTNATLNATRIVPNGTVGINATVVNVGDANGSAVVGATMNFSVVATERVALAPGENATVSLSHRVADSGNYSVTVNGTRAGYVVVKKRGLLGGLVHAVVGLLPSGLVPPFVGDALGGLPLGLIGMALGAIVAVVVVASLALRLLRRVRGSGQSGNG